jgi:hypothetical protein
MFLFIFIFFLYIYIYEVIFVYCQTSIDLEPQTGLGFESDFWDLLNPDQSNPINSPTLLDLSSPSDLLNRLDPSRSLTKNGSPSV